MLEECFREKQHYRASATQHSLMKNWLHHAGSGWRIHWGVNVTESSTNKQHSLNWHNVVGMAAAPESICQNKLPLTLVRSSGMWLQVLQHIKAYACFWYVYICATKCQSRCQILACAWMFWQYQLTVLCLAAFRLRSTIFRGPSTVLWSRWWWCLLFVLAETKFKTFFLFGHAGDKLFEREFRLLRRSCHGPLQNQAG